MLNNTLRGPTVAILMVICVFIAANATPGADPPLSQSVRFLETALIELQVPPTDNAHPRRVAQRSDDLNALKLQLKASDIEARAEFARIETHLRQNQAPATITKRHQAAVKQYQQQMATLSAQLELIEAADSVTQRQAQIQQTLRQLQSFQPAEVMPNVHSKQTADRKSVV